MVLCLPAPGANFLHIPTWDVCAKAGNAAGVHWEYESNTAKNWRTWWEAKGYFWCCTSAGQGRPAVILKLCEIPPWRSKGPRILLHELGTEAMPARAGAFKSTPKWICAMSTSPGDAAAFKAISAKCPAPSPEPLCSPQPSSPCLPLHTTI